MLDKNKVREYLHSITTGFNMDTIYPILSQIDQGIFDTRRINSKEVEYLTDQIDIILINLERADLEKAKSELNELKSYINE